MGDAYTTATDTWEKLLAVLTFDLGELNVSLKPCLAFNLRLDCLKQIKQKGLLWPCKIISSFIWYIRSAKDGHDNLNDVLAEYKAQGLVKVELIIAKFVAWSSLHNHDHP